MHFPVTVICLHFNIHKVFSDGSFLRRCTDPAKSTTLFMKEIHGAPPNSFVVKLSEVMGSFESLRTMALFWFKVVAEVSSLFF